MGFSAQDPIHDGLVLPPNANLSNGYSSAFDFAIPLGPVQTMDYHLDLSKVVGNHTISAGGMYYHIRAFDDGWGIGAGFSTVGTAQDGTANGTGFSPASFAKLGTPGQPVAPGLALTGADQLINWFGWYAQDTWQATRNLVITVGIRWDYVLLAHYHRVESGLDMANGAVCITGAVQPQFPNATCPSGYFYKQFNGWEPRFGITYRPVSGTVLHLATAILDDHNNTVMQENQNIRLSWPDAAETNLQQPGSRLADERPVGAPSPARPRPVGANNPFSIGYGADPHNKIPYSIEYNMGLEQTLQRNLSLSAAYVGSVGRHQYVDVTANTAITPGAGPISARAAYPQYGSFSYSFNCAPSNYNALQVEVHKQMSSGLSFKVVVHTWSKSMDWQSDPYDTAPVDFYNIASPDNGPSDDNRGQMFVFSGIYQLPFGRGKQFLSSANAITDTFLGGWSLGSIISLYSGQPFDVLANGDVANTGWGSQRAVEKWTRQATAPSGGGREMA